MATQMLEGLYSLHASNIVHRDISSSNILFTQDHNLKLGHLGSEKEILHKSQEQTAPKAGEAKLTFPPEMTKSKCYDQRSDIFSLGCVVYELCAFAAPFEAKEEPGNQN